MTLANSIHAKIGATAPTFLQNGGATGVLMRRINWTLHPLGPPERWPVALQTILSVVLGSRQPMCVCWGPELHTLYNDGYAEICGARHPAGLGAPLLDLWDLIRDVIAVANQGSDAAFQGDVDTFAGNPRYWDVRVTPMLDEAGHPEWILAVSRDISYVKQIEDEREQLTQELAHRLRNACGMVQSVIGQTLRHATSLPDARETLSGRVRALADAQDILTRSVAGDMQIDDVVQAALLPYRTGEGRFTIRGPDATISGRQGLGLSLALHELCTNATKYGALSGDVGHVAVSWDVQRDGAFAFRWLECGGPSVAPPEKSGFGSVLIEKIVASYFNGSATLDFHQTGVAFHLSGKIVVSIPPAGKKPQ